MGAERGGERRRDGRGNLEIEGKEAGAPARPELLPMEELERRGSVNDSVAPAAEGLPLPGEGASLLGRTKNRAASAIWCSAKFQH